MQEKSLKLIEKFKRDGEKVLYIDYGLPSFPPLIVKERIRIKNIRV